jgi:hypothetical protein
LKEFCSRFAPGFVTLRAALESRTTIGARAALESGTTIGARAALESRTTIGGASVFPFSSRFLPFCFAFVFPFLSRFFLESWKCP